jgi:transposase
MPTQRLSMRRIKEVLRLKHVQGLPERAIARTLGISNGAVHSYLRRAGAAGLNWPLPVGMTDEDLELLLFPAPRPASQSPQRPVPDWGYVDKELRRRNVTRRLLWDEYRASHPDGFGYTWFCTTYEAWKGRARPSMRQTHLGGEKVFVDFAGDTIDVIDPSSGEVQSMKLFVAAMGASNYTYAEACPSEGLADWIRVHINLFAFLGGAPTFVVCDNLKAAVTNPDRHDPGLNRTYAEMASHYGTAILAARPRRPKDKAKVEVAVQVAQRWILARLRNQRFFSLAELNAAIKILVVELNARQMRDFGASRAELFSELDNPSSQSCRIRLTLSRAGSDAGSAPTIISRSMDTGIPRHIGSSVSSSMRALTTGQSRSSTTAAGSPATLARPTGGATPPSPTTCPAPIGATANGRPPG